MDANSRASGDRSTGRGQVVLAKTRGPFQKVGLVNEHEFM